MEKRALLVGCESDEKSGVERYGFICNEVTLSELDSIGPNRLEDKLRRWLRLPRAQANLLEDMESLFLGASDCFQVVFIGIKAQVQCEAIVKRVMDTPGAAVATFIQITDLQTTQYFDEEYQPHIVELSVLVGQELNGELVSRLLGKQTALRAYIALHDKAYATFSRAAFWAAIWIACLAAFVGKIVELTFQEIASTPSEKPILIGIVASVIGIFLLLHFGLKIRRWWLRK